MENNDIQIMSVKEAGAKGGMKTSAKYGTEHFRQIGKLGQAAQSVRVTSQERRKWGSMGGRPRRPKYTCLRGEKEAK